ncbi:MAG: hypothetical protein ACREJV_13965 [Candidatus Rokuibacteriota bacterium]
MSWKRLFSRCLVGTGVVLLTAGVAGAQNATLYEVTETMKLRGRGPEYRTRTATAALSGTIEGGTTLCPSELTYYLGIEKCGVVAIAWDNLNLANGKGPVKGSFSVVIQGDNKVDGYELAIARGTIHGQIDLSAALIEGLPMGTLDGNWSAQGARGGPLAGLKLKGRVSGVFRLPFVYGFPESCLDTGMPVNCRMVSPPSYLFGEYPHVYPKDVQANERSLGVPAVRLDLDFVTTGESRGKDRRGGDDD